MKTRILLSVWFLAAAAGVSLAGADEATPPDPSVALATQARDILRQHCYECHGQKQEAYQLNIKQHASVTDANNLYVVPKNLDDSQIWQALAVSKKMPPPDRPRLTTGEIAIVKEWIEKGATQWPLVIPPRNFVSDIEVLTAIRDDLRKTDGPDRPFRRYFSLQNLHNNWLDVRFGRGDSVEPETLALARAALSKACNSLSMENQIVVPQVIDKSGVLLRIDLRDFGWDKANQWSVLLKSYPYGLKYNLHRNQDVRAVAEEVAELSGTELPCVRVDWFLDTATRPVLYRQILQLPDTAQEVEKMLKVDVIGDFNRDRLVRAGFAESGVSRSNRLVDRHPAAFGAYWKSYDFGKSEGKGNLFKFPLGPDFPGSAFGRQAFEHDGGEMIFNLPNGLQGYYLTKANGERLDEGPIAVVRDLQETGGSPVVLNGLSCMACHANGMKRFEDTIRTGIGVQGAAALKVDRLFPSPEKMKTILDQDEERFLTAARRAMGPFLDPANPGKVNVKNYKEPIGAMARLYQKDIALEEAAAELGMEDAKTLKVLIENNARLRQFGLGPLTTGAAIKREAWSSVSGFLSTFQKVASELDIATPHREL